MYFSPSNEISYGNHQIYGGSDINKCNEMEKVGFAIRKKYLCDNDING